MCVEIKIDSLDDMCDDNYLDLKQDDIEVKIKYLNIDMININYKLDLNRLNFYEPSYRYKKNFTRNLLTGIYNGYKFYIQDLGRFPTAYIEISKKDKIYNINYMDSMVGNIETHFGLTYSRDYLVVNRNVKNVNDCTIKDSWFMGWDYNHLGDYTKFNNIGDWTTNVYGKKWTTKEILHDCISVINQIIKINKGEKDEQN